MAQAARSLVQLGDAQQLEHRAHHAHAAANDGLAVFAHTGHAQLVGALGGNQSLQQPVQAFLGNAARRPTGCHQHIADSAHGTGRSVGRAPVVGVVGVQRFVQYSRGGNLGHLKGFFAELAIGKVAGGPGNAAHAKGLHDLGCQALAQDQLGGASTNVDHQAALVAGRQHVGDALVNQARFFAARDHVDGKAQHLVAAL